MSRWLLLILALGAVLPGCQAAGPRPTELAVHPTEVVEYERYVHDDAFSLPIPVGSEVTERDDQVLIEYRGAEAAGTSIIITVTRLEGGGAEPEALLGPQPAPGALGAPAPWIDEEGTVLGRWFPIAAGEVCDARTAVESVRTNGRSAYLIRAVFDGAGRCDARREPDTDGIFGQFEVLG
jgi:hypothetical protein